MNNAKIFSAVVLCLALLLSTAMAIDLSDKYRFADDDPTILPGDRAVPRAPNRDYPDDVWTLRFMYSADGGANWGDITGLGDLGMWEIDLLGDTVSAWSENPNTDFGAVIDNNNCLHYIVVLNHFNEDEALNPSGRVNGVYDVMTDNEGNATVTLIAADENNGFFYADGGIDADGNIYAMWTTYVFDDEGAVAYWQIWASKTIEDGWADPFLVADELSAGYDFAHMTYTVGEFFYVVYQANVEGNFHFIAKVPASLEGDVIITATGISSSHPYYAYKFGSCNPIDQVLQAEGFDNGIIYCCLSDEDRAGTHIGSSEDGENWDWIHYAPQDEVMGGVARYPSMAMDPLNEMPWMFSNWGVFMAAGEQHVNCYTYDEVGYNGGSWIDPPIAADRADYDGDRFILYCHNAIWTTDGTMIRGCNRWGGYTPEEYHISIYNADEDTWSDPNILWTIFVEEDALMGGSVAMNHILAGAENSVWVAFSGIYGETDFTPPECRTVSVSSFMLGEDKVVTTELSDDSGIPFEADGAMFNWIKEKAGEDHQWDYVSNADSMDVDELGSGTYWFHLPDAVMFEGEEQALSPGDTVYFYCDAYDRNGLYGSEPGLQTWIVNVSVTQVPDGDQKLPLVFELGQNYPNPFNSSTVIPFSIDQTADVNLSVYDIHGRLIEMLHSGQLPAGNHTISWFGETVSTGIYFYVLEANGQRHIAKMTLLR